MDTGGIDINILWPPLLSGTLGAAVARFLIASTLKKIAEVPDEIAAIKTQLAVIVEKVEKLTEIRDLVHEHDKTIAVIEDRCSGYKRSDKPGKARGE